MIHTHTHTHHGRTPLDEGSAHRRDLYLTTHDSRKRQTSMPPEEFEPATPASERPDPRLRPRDHRNRFLSPLTSVKFRFFRDALYWCFDGGTEGWIMVRKGRYGARSGRTLIVIYIVTKAK